MHAHLFPPRLNSSLAAVGLALAALTGFAQQSAIPDAPTVPMAPTLPDAAVVREPLAPAASQEIAEERPSGQHLWVAGHWRWQDNRYAWIAGRWEMPPRANVVWVEPRWDRRGNGYVLGGGYWQETAVPTSSPVITPSSPAPIVATRPSVQQAPVYQSAPGYESGPQNTIIVQQAPPPPMREYIIERPSPRYVWIDGYWAWRGDRHVWVPGRWDLPPRERLVWVEPRWERRSNGYVFVEGSWRDADRSDYSGGVSLGNSGPGPNRRMISVREPPPPPRREFIDERYRPSRSHVWASGYWRHEGRAYVWMPGHWDMPPRGYRDWDAPRWEPRDGNYIFIEGRWH